MTPANTFLSCEFSLPPLYNNNNNNGNKEVRPLNSFTQKNKGQFYDVKHFPDVMTS